MNQRPETVPTPTLGRMRRLACSPFDSVRDAASQNQKTVKKHALGLAQYSPFSGSFPAVRYHHAARYAPGVTPTWRLNVRVK